jgi:hypothetical protein
MNTQCASNIHQILVACNAYLNDFHTYPINFVNTPMGGDSIQPQDQQSRTLNQLSIYLGNFPALTDTTPTGSFPSQLLCPFVDVSDGAQIQTVGNGYTYWYTGYGYYSGLDQYVNYTDASGTVWYQTWYQNVRIAGECADTRGIRRGALWGDAAAWWGYSGGPAGLGMWWYSHTNYSSPNNSTFSSLWHFTPASFGGQNMGYSDGSVQFNATLDFKPADFANNVAYWDAGEYWWWF